MSSPSSQLRHIWSPLTIGSTVEAGLCDPESPLAFLTQGDKASTIPEAAYRYCRYEPGVHVVLTGTGNPEHLKANVESILKPPLVEADLERLRKIFSQVDSVSGN